MQAEIGFYVYIGSAFGAGGVAARLSRHFRMIKSKHWHIDYLREISTPLSAWVSYDSIRWEHNWAEQLTNHREFMGILGFGCSDCNCRSHLFFTSSEATLSLLGSLLKGSVEKW